MFYKPEIDGLRALAVFLVLLCHMQLAGAVGGFIGVDVFFVISGFLITSIIVGSIDKDKFSFWNFYGRRFVRLYPALLTVVLLTFIAGFILADPATLKQIARVARYVLFSITNIFFKNNLGYFDVAAQKQIFLHTWTLGVEWQFYIAWPAIIWLVTRFTRNRTVLISTLALITLASLLASQWAVHHDLKAAYYLVYYRAFELGIGALLVFLYPKNPSPTQGVLLVIAGVIAILACSFLFYTPTMLFPGFAGLVPCLAAAAIIWGGKTFTKGNVFRWAPIVYIGKASYSIYLVHWPLLVLTQYYFYRHLTISERIILVIASLVLGAALYSLVETQINWRSLKNKLKGSLVLLALTIALVPFFYYVGKQGDGLPWRMAKGNTLAESQYHDWGVAHFPEAAMLGELDGELVAVIGGDSFAANMSIGFHDELSKRGQKAERYYKPGCLVSIIDLKGFNIPQHCRDNSQLVLDRVTATPNLPLIIIQAWGGPAVDADARGEPSFDMDKQRIYNEQILLNLDDVRARIGDDHPIFIVSSPPYLHWEVSEKECLLRPDYLPQVCKRQALPYPVDEAPSAHANRALKAYAQTRPNTYYIDTSVVACPSGICTAEHNAKLYFDGYHTSTYGAEVIVADVMRQIEAIQKSKNEEQ